MANEWLLPFAALFTADSATRERATNSIAMTMMPVAPAMRGGIAALAVTQQASDGVRREVRVAGQTVDAMALAASQSQPLAPADLDRFPALEAVDKPAFAARLNAAVGNTRTPNADELVAFAAHLIAGNGTKISGTDLAKYPTIQRLLGSVDSSGVVSAEVAPSASAPSARKASVGKASVGKASVGKASVGKTSKKR